jgi:uncharacterized protein (DUF433 family)
MARTKPLVTQSAGRAWGASVFAGTRVPVDTLFEYLEAGDTLDEFLRQFPTVTRTQAVAVLEAAKRSANEAAVPA